MFSIAADKVCYAVVKARAFDVKVEVVKPDPGDETGDERAAVRGETEAARSDHTAEYLLGIPLLGDYLEVGLSKLGYSCEEFELGRL